MDKALICTTNLILSLILTLGQSPVGPRGVIGSSGSQTQVINSIQNAITECGTASSCTATFSSATVAGHAIVAAVDFNESFSVSSITHGADTASLCGVTTDFDSEKMAIYVFTNIATTGTSVTLNLSGSSAFSDIIVQEISGANTSNACDATGTSSNTGTGTSFTPAASTATNAKTLAVDYCSVPSATGPWTMTAGWTTISNVGSGGELVEDKYFSSVQTNLNPAITATNSGNWLCALASIVSQ